VNSLLLLFVALVAAPQPDSPEVPAETAAELFASAQAELAAGHYETALDRLRRADEIAPHPATKFHMARCLEELGRLREAWELYGVVAEHADVSVAERTAAAQRRAQVRSRLASVRVQARADGRVILDGEHACDTPCTALADPGTHALEVIWPDQHVEERFELAEAEVREIEIEKPAPPPSAPKPTPLEVGPRDALPPRPARAPVRWPTPLTWVGAPLAGLGGIGVVAFGSSTLAARRDHEADPTSATQTRGHRMRALTNASIAVAVGGGVLLLADAIRYGVGKRRRARAEP
jgi:hypothetical protein